MIINAFIELVLLWKILKETQKEATHKRICVHIQPDPVSKE